MDNINWIFIISGAFVALLGFFGLANPSFTRLINFPGGPRLKATVAIIIGIIFVIAGLIV